MVLNPQRLDRLEGCEIGQLALRFNGAHFNLRRHWLSLDIAGGCVNTTNAVSCLIGAAWSCPQQTRSRREEGKGSERLLRVLTEVGFVDDLKLKKTKTNQNQERKLT
jgi:hypothetical protein